MNTTVMIGQQRNLLLSVTMLHLLCIYLRQDIIKILQNCSSYKQLISVILMHIFLL